MAAFAKCFEDKGKTPPFMFLLNILLPGNPVVCSVMYWALLDEAGANEKMLDMLGRYARTRAAIMDNDVWFVFMALVGLLF